MEVWKDIPEYEGIYQASTQGRIKNSNGLILVQRYDKDGYNRITLTKHIGNKKVLKTYRTHQIIALTFIKTIENKMCVNHKDENKANNVVSNLEWCDRKYNNIYSKNIKHNKKREVINLETNNLFPSLHQAGKSVGVTAGAIYNCCIGKNKSCKGQKFSFA